MWRVVYSCLNNLLLIQGVSVEPQSGDFLTHECAIFVNAPVERVFEIVGDLENSVRWTDSRPVRTIAKVTDGPVGPGTRYRSSEKITMSFGADSEIVGFRPPEMIVWRSKPVGERVPYHRWSFELRTSNGGTELTHRMRAARARGIMGWVQRLGFLFTRPHDTVPANMERALVRIKAIVEDSA
ncbi:MAG: hypothetical protein NVS1B6_14480 [Steroidobacteraceae bacterium]